MRGFYTYFLIYVCIFFFVRSCNKVDATTKTVFSLSAPKLIYPSTYCNCSGGDKNIFIDVFGVSTRHTYVYYCICIFERCAPDACTWFFIECVPINKCSIFESGDSPVGTILCVCIFSTNGIQCRFCLVGLLDKFVFVSYEYVGENFCVNKQN